MPRERDVLDPDRIDDWVNFFAKGVPDAEYVNEVADTVRRLDVWEQVARRAQAIPAWLDVPGKDFTTLREKMAAFRHYDADPDLNLEFRTLAAFKTLINRASSQIDDLAGNDGDSKRQRATVDRFRQSVAHQQILLRGAQQIREGHMPNTPNPRQRAMERLVEDDCDECGAKLYTQWRRLFREEQEVDRKRAEERRALAAANRKSGRRRPV